MGFTEHIHAPDPWISFQRTENRVSSVGDSSRPETRKRSSGVRLADGRTLLRRTLKPIAPSSRPLLASGRTVPIRARVGR